MVLSGLYGLLLAGEPIQLYSCPLTSSVADIWQEGHLLTDILCSCVRRNDVACVVDLTAMEAYRRLIDWQKVGEFACVMHCLDAAAAGESALTSFGGAFRQLLTMDAEALFAMEREGGMVGTCSLHTTAEPPSGYPREVWGPDQAEQILRGALGPSPPSPRPSAQAQPWGFELGSRFYSDVKRRGKTGLPTIIEAIVEICRAPKSHRDVESLQGHGGGLWRYRAGKDRLVYEVDEARHVVRLSRFEARGDVYKGLP